MIFWTEIRILSPQFSNLMEKTIFSKIIEWSIPSYRIYEDTYTYAFLDVFPQMPWHTLIVPKIAVDHFADVPEPYYSAIFHTAKLLAPALQEATKTARICTSFLWYEVPHCHYHLVPTNNEKDMHFSKKPRASEEDLAAMQKNILSILWQ